MLSYAAHRPLTPTLSPEYGGEGARIRSLARLRERAGVRAREREVAGVAEQREWEVSGVAEPRVGCGVMTRTPGVEGGLDDLAGASMSPGVKVPEEMVALAVHAATYAVFRFEFSRIAAAFHVVQARARAGSQGNQGPTSTISRLTAAAPAAIVDRCAAPARAQTT